MIIRSEQIDTLKEKGQPAFRHRMVEHLNKHFPEQCTALGDPALRQEIDYGIGKANTYRIITERDVCKYITLMFAFGRAFDSDPRLPWAAAILRSRVYANGTDRIEALYRTAKRHVRDASRRRAG